MSVCGCRRNNPFAETYTLYSISDLSFSTLITNEVLSLRHQRYIGKVKDAVFHTQKAGRKRVVVSTEENVIASLDLRRGEICKL